MKGMTVEIRRLLSVVCVGAVGISASILPVSVQAEENAAVTATVAGSGIVLDQLELSAEQQQYFEKVVKAGEYFQYDLNGQLVLKADDNTLRDRIGFTNEEIKMLRNSLNGDFSRGAALPGKAEHLERQDLLQPMVHVDRNTLYITNQD